MSDLDKLQKKVGMWGKKTFPNATNYSISAHLRDEVRELTHAVTAVDEVWDVGEIVDDLEGIQTEAADCLLLLLNLAHRNGFSLFDAAVAKMAINEKRTWNTVTDAGYTKHDEVPA